jgi:hypothetical protein
VTATFVFTCSICGEPSQTICSYCTKDACANHTCERCKRCSDCCECEVRLQDASAQPPIGPEIRHSLPEPATVEIIGDPFAVEPEEIVEPEAESETATEPLLEPIADETADLSKLFAPEAETPAPQPDLSALFAPDPPAAAPAPSAPQPDLSALFAPDPPAASTPPAGDLSALFAPEHDHNAAPADCDAAILPPGEADMSKLFAPEPPPKPKPPIFSPDEESDPGEEPTPEE